jgi:DNA invertase Pin-like site-specific DNA recombinase
MARTAVAYLSPEEQAAEIGASAQLVARDLDVLEVVREGRGPPRDRLAIALERIAGGGASAVLAAHLSTVAGSLRELVALIDWLGASSADLVVLDVGLDTGTPAGRRIVRVLRELDRLEREGVPGRTKRGRPGLAVRAPNLRAQITAMRERGASLQAIADALNADGVPTQRGGAHWRPSSVQAALGYRRPHPPAPGAPPRPHPPGHPKRGPRRPAKHKQPPGRRPPQP